MIPEYHLINSLINLPSNKITKKAIKRKTKTFKYDKKRKFNNFIFNINNNRVFNHIINLDAELNQFSLDPYYANIVDFNFFIAGLMPIYEFQIIYYKDYKQIQEILFNASLTNSDIQKWYQESLNLEKINIEDLKFILDNKKIPKEIKNKIISLTHVSGQLFETLSTNNYQLGYYFMLFYLLTLETRKTIQLRSITNWNLKSYFEYEDIFSYKLMILKKLNQILMELKEKNFNLYLRVINNIISGYSE